MRNKTLLATILFFTSTVVCNAQTTIPSEFQPDGTAQVVNSFGPEAIAAILQFFAGVLIGLAAPLAIIFLIIAGIQYATSYGAPEPMEKAKTNLIWTIVGLVIIIFSYFIIQAVLGLVLTLTEESSVNVNADLENSGQIESSESSNNGANNNSNNSRRRSNSDNPFGVNEVDLNSDDPDDVFNDVFPDGGDVL